MMGNNTNKQEINNQQKMSDFFQRYINNMYYSQKLEFEKCQIILQQIKKQQQNLKENQNINDFFFSVIKILNYQENIKYNFEGNIVTSQFSKNLQQQQLQEAIELKYQEQYYIFSIKIVQRQITEQLKSVSSNNPPQQSYERIYQKYEDYKEQKATNQIKNFSTSKNGLPNISGSCYINTALQAVRQIYKRNQQLFLCSQLGLELKKLFDMSEQQLPVKSQLMQFIEQSRKHQQHLLSGGDSYTSLINFLSELENSYQSKQDHKSYQNELQYNRVDGFFCSRCQQYLQNGNYYDEDFEIGFEVCDIQQAISPKSNYDELGTLFKCSQCHLQLIPKRSYLSLPKFLFIKLENQFNCQNTQFTFKTIKKDKKYDVIGIACNSGFHYTYQGLDIDRKWYLYNDQNVSQLSTPSFYNAIFLVLQAQV
ncbi:hypothetical protein ABPG74_017992 [Tetrahymena malaccensis]